MLRIHFKKSFAIFTSLLMMIAILSTFNLTASAICCRKDGFDKSRYTLTGNQAEDVAAIAKSQKGRTGADFGYTEAWCDEFVADCLENAGCDSSIVGHGGTVADFEEIMREQKGAKPVDSPQAGDLVFFTYSHVEIVTKVENGVVYCAGGNNGGTGNYKTNYCAGERELYATARLYLRPNYPNSKPAPDPPTLSINQTTGTPDDVISITWSPAQYADSYWLHIYKDGNDYVNQTLNQDLSYSAKYPAGNYTAYVVSCNSKGEALSSIDFIIYGSNPEIPHPQIGKSLYSADEIVEVTWNSTADTTHYWLHTYKDGSEFENTDMYNNLSYARTYPAGHYTLYIASYNNYGESHDCVEFTVYDNIPKAPEVKIENDLYSADEPITVKWSETANTTHYWLHTYKDGEEFENTDIYNNLSYSRTYPAGHYKLFIASYNDYGESHEYVEFLVYNKGDCNGDGEFTVSDVVLLQKWILADSNAELTNWKAADLCEDGRLDVFDLCLMKRMLIEQN